MRLGVIVLDTLRYDTAINELSRLREEAAREFRNCYSPSRWTSPSHASLFTGYYPTEIGVHAGQRHLTTPESTLAERFKQAGYRTVAASNNINVDRFFDFDRGFDTFHRGPGISDRPEENVSEFNWGDLEKKIANSGVRRPIEAVYHILRSDAPTMATLKTGIKMFLGEGEQSRGIEWSRDIFSSVAEENPDDLFFFANFMPCHHPYNPPEEYFDGDPVERNPIEMSLGDKPVTEEDHERYWSGYVGAAQYLDDVLPGFIDEIEWDALFVIGDHGELFDDHGLYGHQYGVYEELTHVPAIAIGEAVPEDTTTAPTSILDIPRTLLELADIDAATEIRGTNLFEDIPQDRVVYAESEGCEWYDPDATGIESEVPPSWADPHHMIRQGEVIYISDKDGERAFEPESGEERPDLVSELREIAEEIRDSRSEFTGEEKDEELSEDIERRLEHLGYK